MTTDTQVIDTLPEIGEFIVVHCDGCTPRFAVIISMEECRIRAPELFGHTKASNACCSSWAERPDYQPDDTIRAWLDEEGKASFCIMRFNARGKIGGYYFNKFIMKCPDLARRRLELLCVSSPNEVLPA